MSILIPEERILVREALPALGQLAAFLFIIGCIYVIDGFVRALFGTITGAVGWIPYAGKVLKAPVHRIEQKVTHALGTAEEAFDRRIGTSFHKLAAIARRIPGELLDLAKLILGVTILLGYLPTKKLVLYLIHVATRPLHAAWHQIDRRLGHDHAQTKALQKSVAQGVYPRLKVGTKTIGHVVGQDIPNVRARERADADAVTRAWKWILSHRKSLAAGAFIGATAWALARLGGSWIRCSNWRKIGNRVCHLPPSLVDALLAALLAELALANLHRLAEFGQEVTDDATRGIGDLLGIHNLPSGRFTIE